MTENVYQTKDLVDGGLIRNFQTFTKLYQLWAFIEGFWEKSFYCNANK